MSNQNQHSFHAGSIILALLLLLLATACKPSPGKLNEDGNEAFANGNYVAALTDYQQAQTADPQTAEPYYNAANTLYRQEAYNDAQGQLQQALQHAQGDLTQNSLYNLGNSYYSAEQLDAAIKAYQEALLLNPNDQDAKYNLELALQQQQQQQEQQQENQKQQEGNRQDQKQNQDQPQDQGDQEQDSQNQDQGDQNQDQPQDQVDQNQDQAQDEGQSNPDQQNEPTDQPGQNGQEQAQNRPSHPGSGQPVSLTPEQAQQLLSAIAQDTQTLQEKLQQTVVVPQPPPAEDW